MPRPIARLDDAEQPKDEDQDQQPAKTDIHDIPPLLVLMVKRSWEPPGCSRFVCGTERQGNILPVRKAPDLLDFWAFDRD